MQDHKNHHYVSKVHLKNFFNDVEKKIYVLDKQRNNIYPKLTTKTLFSEENLNSRYKDGKFDYNTLENELNEYFEKDFNIHYAVIEQYAKDWIVTRKVKNSIEFMAKYGIVGELRVPRFKKFLDDSLFNTLSELTSNATDDLKQQFKEFQDNTNKLKYSNLVGYADVADKAIKKMGKLIFQVSIPLYKDDYFLVPDVCSATLRAKINKYFNPDLEDIAYISLTLSSKIHLSIYSSKLEGSNQKSSVRVANSIEVFEFNRANYDYCESKVACESQLYLQMFKDKVNLLK